MGFLTRLIAVDPAVGYMFAGLALLRGTLWLWLQYERTKTAIACLRRVRQIDRHRPPLGSCGDALG